MEMKSRVLSIELHYLPCIQYFVYLNSFEKIIIAQDDPYIRQSYRNRCRINGANKVDDLIIPVKKTSKDKSLSCDVIIDNNQKWLNKHLRAIQSAYGKAPFFEFYADDIFEILNRGENNLFDLNKELLTKCLEILDLKISIVFSRNNSDVDKKGLYDAKNEINPKTPADKNALFTPFEYFQVFGNNFAANLSVIDLIFCEGPQARHILEKSCA
ncbi:MAG: WbqC family protein [Cytophagales bacterium]|nr:WbqC family protein [Cytophagales bacterium]